MTDLTRLLAEVRRTEVSYVDMIKRRAKATHQWFLENDVHTHPIHNNNELQFLMCGQEGFAAIEQDIRRATRSIDLVLWGFDPGMELVRKGKTWPRGTPYGDLLIAKAREGVKVRLLVWYEGNIINALTRNAIDIGTISGVKWSPSDKALNTPEPSSNGVSSAITLTERSNYCRQWWTQALRGAHPNLEIRLRRMHPAAIARNAQTHLPDSAPSFSERKGMKHVATHHQKPILIDYPTPGNQDKKLNTCAYVMGLNSVTDYWDTPRHGYNDPLRELSPASGTITERSMWYVKPYRDYAIRVQGEALYNINENFVQGWDNADGYGSMNGAPKSGPRLAEQRQATRPKDIARPAGAGCRAQIIRTYPDQGEATILKAYTLASANAMNYIYVENQYVQLPEWPRLLKKIRQKHRAGLEAAGVKPADIAPLHVFVVMPQPEREQMVPNTYDTLNQLGQAQGMRAYDKQVQGQRRAPDQGVWSRAATTVAYAARAVMNPLDTAEEASKRAVAQESLDAAPANPAGELNDLGIKALAAMLMTYDAADQAKDIRIKDRDNDAQRAQAMQEEKDNARAKVHDGKANDVDLERRDECTIQPRRYREIYIHSKLMFVDDVYTTLGSANLNARSMVGDSEFNICTESYTFTQAARKRVWGNLAGSDLDGKSCSREETALTFKDWKDRMQANMINRKDGNPPVNDSFIHPFEDPRGAPIVRLV